MLSVLLLRVLPGSQAMPAAVLVLLIAGAAAILPISGRTPTSGSQSSPARSPRVCEASTGIGRGERARASRALSTARPSSDRSRCRRCYAAAARSAPISPTAASWECSRTQSWARTRPSSSCTHAPSACSLRPSMSDVSSSGVTSLLPWRAGAPQSVVSRSSSTPRPLTVTFDSQQPSVEGGARRCNSRNLRAKPSSRERPAHAAITPRGSPPDRAETPKCSCWRRGPPRLSGRPGT